LVTAATVCVLLLLRGWKNPEIILLGIVLVPLVACSLVVLGRLLTGDHPLGRADAWLRNHPWASAALLVVSLIGVVWVSNGRRAALSGPLPIIWIGGFLAEGAIFSWYKKRRPPYHRQRIEP